MTETRPNFFIVGAAKSGTTSMYEYLRQHPQIFMSKVKEPYFFGRDLEIVPYWCIRDEAKYLKLFAGAGNAKRIGEGSVWYLCSREAAREIKAFSPSARILIMLRNPIDVLYSLHGQFLHSCNEDITDFGEALAAQDDRRRGRRIPRDAHFPRGLLYTDLVSYSSQVQRYLEVFGREQVHVVTFDDLIDDAPGVYRQVLDFLEVDAEFTPSFDVHNPAKVIRNRWVTSFLKKRPRLRHAVLTAVPESARQRIGDALALIFRPLRRQSKLNPALRIELQTQFAPEIEALGKILDRDLSHWCGDSIYR